MVSRPYTAVLISGEKTRIINIDAPIESYDAKTYIQEKFPSERVVALIPGEHASHSYAFNSREINRPNVHIDLFDMSHVTKNNA